MRVLLTGAFGNIGTATLEELLRRGHRVRCFELRTARTRRVARRYRGQVETVWGDLRRTDDISATVEGQDAVIHTAAVIPRLSATGVNSEDRPQWSREINVGGTRNLIRAMKALPHPPELVYTSSLHVFGRTQHLEPPRRVGELPRPVEHYARHKLACEELIRESGLSWSILRLGAALPVRLILDAGMFEVPLDNRIEYVHSRDVALALANTLECGDTRGRILLIGGGARCQFRYGDLLSKVLSQIGVSPIPASAFTQVPYSVDWLDTEDSQRLLQYQTRTLDDYLADMAGALGPRRIVLIRLLGPIVRRLLLARSPYRRCSRRAAPKPALGSTRAG